MKMNGLENLKYYGFGVEELLNQMVYGKEITDTRVTEKYLISLSEKD